MERRAVVLYPSTKALLKQTGKQIKMARIRRKQSMELVAERAKISRQTLWKIENGDPAVSMGAYLSVLFALTLEKDILKLAEDEELRRIYEENELLRRRGKGNGVN